MNSIISILIAVFFLLALVFGVLIYRSWRLRRFMGAFTYLLLTLVMMLSGLLAIVISVGSIGYKALTREDLAATVFITPLGSQQFTAKVVRPGRRDTAFTIAGDELYVDARILKWKPFVNVLGLRTGYCLDRVAGRYTDIGDERTKLRTLYSFGGTIQPWDLFFLRTRYSFLSPILDAYYGSAAFVPVRDVKSVKILVTASGLIARSQ
ncbi:MAG TPA: hypothetical protein VLX68_13965 [Chitinivibrionales bacterium]|nr:hypothetical protein [Chitinivibrionales bacterium]